MSSKNEIWSVCNKSGDFSFIMNSFGVTASTARLLINRGKTTREDIMEYLYPDESMLYPQNGIRNLTEAADVIDKKLSSHSRVRVIGDYDADGIMSTFILTDALNRIGAEADFYIPDRLKDGYGLNPAMIDMAADAGVDLIITCDNGIAATEAALKAKEKGITLVITDHHELPEILPEADVIVDPKHPDDTYPCKNICGAVVAAKLAAELLERRGLVQKGTGSLKYLEFMAIATICDVVPMEGENRTIASLGLKILNERYLSLKENRTDLNKGLKALIDVCEIKGKISDYTIGFVIGPCLNATGRLDLASTAMRLLTSKNEEEALGLARECKELNEARKDMTLKETEKAFDILDSISDLDRVLVVELPECHESLAGIIAGRIREKYLRPAFVLTKGKEGMKGSGRSIPGYNMFEEMQKCADLFTKFGGHPMAAGLSLPEESVKTFRKRMNENCTLTEDDMKKKVLLDAKAAVSCFDEKGIEELDLFSPFGQGNPAPIFGDTNVSLLRLRRIGKNNNWLKMTVRDSRGAVSEAVCFKDADEVIKNIEEKYGPAQVELAFAGGNTDIKLNISYVPEINEYNGARSIQMKIQGFLF